MWTLGAKEIQSSDIYERQKHKGLQMVKGAGRQIKSALNRHNSRIKLRYNKSQNAGEKHTLREHSDNVQNECRERGSTQT